ncbi:polymorphic toxin type 24 domain-containing protein, partial [Asaia platycodi]|uniref:polymorphic toxin type 24 domain-containing protein n=1 Tax=Asaia platycodi TaxID=610243 RepID=UPI001900B10A
LNNAAHDGESAGGSGEKTSESEKGDGDGTSDEQNNHNQDDTPPSPKPRNESDLSGGPLENATKWSGHFPDKGGPSSGTLYRADNKGNITSYATYDKDGLIVKRVDVTGKPHGGVPTPHVLEATRNIAPNGTVHVAGQNVKCHAQRKMTRYHETYSDFA